MSSVVIAGDTSGTVTLDAPAVAGTTVLTLPATSGTVITGTGGVVSAANGGTGLTSVGTNGNVLTSNGTAWVSQALPAGGVTSLNGQTGAITTNTFGAIGSTVGIYGPSFSNYGDTTAGSNLTGLNAAGSVISLGLSGTWRFMGNRTGAVNNGNIAIRIS